MRNEILRTDEDVWNAFKKNDVSAYELMFSENYAILLSYGMRFTRDEDEVKDCVQQLFTGLWESRNRLGYNNYIKGYLLASIRRMILRRSKLKTSFTNMENLNPKFLLEGSVESKLIQIERDQEIVKRLKDLVETLPNRQKQAIYLRFYDGHGFSEISEMMGITTRVVYKLIYKAIAKIGGHLDQNQGFNKYSPMIATS